MSKRPNDAGIKGELGDPDKQLGYGSLMLLLSSENTTKLINLAKSHGVKPNTIVSVAWANTGILRVFPKRECVSGITYNSGL
jgi:hypothetical protein